MRKEWLWIGVAAVLLSACTAPTTEQQAPQQPYNGPVVEIGGVEPQYEPYNPNNMQDYKVNGDTYRIVKDPQNFSQTGLAAWYGEEANGNTTALGEQFDPNGLTAAHPTLPIPSYVRVTNLANGRQLVVRVNDRGPYTKGRIIDLSKAAADRLNLSNNTKVKVDFINVAPDGTLSGPGRDCDR
ncbi:endolytic peptidoglycan transglycosylase RlpA, partial [Serratia nevei]|uniref:endolytic peptidoglycan transglycosylase RlpA n=1 Tax=Serratia nevei TaxID=2703794 RepID=UPI003F82222E